MSKKIKTIVFRIIFGILIFSLAVGIAGYLFIKLYIVPKYNASLGENETQEDLIDEKDLLGYAKYLADGQVIDNIVNFNKDSAKDVLVAMQESDAEEKVETPVPKVSKKMWSKQIVEKVEAIPTPAPSPTLAPEKSAPKTAKGSTARERIMNAASDSEISAGLAILSKVSLSKVNQLRRAGKNAELKAYIKSVLTPAEINKALSLYNKYKHLL